MNEDQKYQSSDQSIALVQGEILSNVVQVKAKLDTIATPKPTTIGVVHTFAIVVSQSCDLEQDFRYRFVETAKLTPYKILPSIIFCEMELAQTVAVRLVSDDTKKIKASSVWKNIQRNKNERYHFFEKVDSAEDAASENIPELVVDFKRYFTVPTDELYKRIAMGEATRHCFLRGVYATHFSTRFAFFQLRVALPNDHESDYD